MTCALSRSIAALAAAAALLVAAALGPQPAGAHAKDEGVFVTLMGGTVTGATPTGATLVLHIANNTDEAVTLRGFNAAGASRVVIEQRSSLLGVASWREVDALRVEPDGSLLLAAPEYRVLAVSDNPRGVLTAGPIVEADFGPLGVIAAEKR